VHRSAYARLNRENRRPASQDIDKHTSGVAQTASEANAKIRESQKAIIERAEAALLKPQDGSSNSVVDQEASKQVLQLSDELKAKPERDFTNTEHFTRGLALFRANNYAGALASFEAASEGPNLSPSDAARYLFAQGVTLSGAERVQDAITVYNMVEQRYGQDGNPAMRELVAKALFNKGVEVGKLHGPKQSIAVYDSLEQRYGQDNSLAMRERVAKALYNRGVEVGKLHGSEQEIAVYDSLEQRYGQDSSPAVREQVAIALVNKGVEVGKLHGPGKAIAVYDSLEQRYGQDISPAVREIVARTKNSSAFNNMMLAKTHWADESQRVQRLRKAILHLKEALGQSPEDAVMSGNLGYCLFLLGEAEPARKWTRACLEAGGEAQLDGQRSDARKHRVEPLDTKYEALLNELWSQVQSKTVPPLR
jgi:tetratricopeptide (TPR) repeat protein